MTTMFEGRVVNEYDKADDVKVKATFTADGELADPTDILLQVRQPSGVILNFHYGVGATVVRDSTGTYHANLFINDDGRYDYRWAGSGSVTSSDRWYFIVRRSDFP